MRRTFLITNWYEYEDCAMTIMFSDIKPTKAEAFAYLVHDLGLEGFDIHEGMTCTEEYIDNNKEKRTK